MIVTIIYLSGVIFFLLQAARYAHISWARVRGAVAWPLLILVAPQVWENYRRKIERVESELAHDECVTLEGFTLGNDESRFFWGIGA